MENKIIHQKPVCLIYHFYCSIFFVQSDQTEFGSMLSFIKGIGEKDNGKWSWIDELWTLSLMGESEKLFDPEEPHSSAIWNRYNDAIAFISGGILFSLKDQAKTQISDWYTSDFEWKDDKSLVYVQGTDQIQNIYESEIGAESIGLTNFKENKGITKICILDDSRIAYNTRRGSVCRGAM